MSHINAGIFQAYMNERIQCDVQAAFLGRPSAEALFKAMSHMSRDIDPRAPTQLTKHEVDDLKTHPLIVELRERRDALSKETRKTYGTLQKAKEAGGVIHELYKEANSDLNNAKTRLRKERLGESRVEFFDRIETDDARRQLEMLALGVKEEDWQPTGVSHSLQERKRVAELLCKSQSTLTGQEMVLHRAITIDALVSLCCKKEIPQKQTVYRDRNWGILPTPDPSPQRSPEPSEKGTLHPIVITNKECIFCICKTGQRRGFCRPRKAREHVENQHLRFFRDDDLIPCPDPSCRLSGLILYGHSHFKNHLASIHGCSLLPYSLHHTFDH
jgi:hypothetical protein